MGPLELLGMPGELGVWRPLATWHCLIAPSRPIPGCSSFQARCRGFGSVADGLKGGNSLARGSMGRNCEKRPGSGHL